MATTTSAPLQPLKLKALELGISEEILSCALNIIYQNRNYVNALDNTIEMDDYIYRAVLKQAFERCRKGAEAALDDENISIRSRAQKDLSIISREELITDPFYRAVLPLLVKVTAKEPILRLYAEVASSIVLELADFKRRHRATSLTEVIIRRYGAEMEIAKA
jgi:hypothetical protein